MGWEEKAAKAKKGHRPSLKNWERDGLYEKFPPYAEFLLSPSTNPYSSLKIDSRTGRAEERSWSLDCARRKRAMSPPTQKLQAMQIDNDRTIEETTPMYPIVLDAKDTPPELFHEQYEAKVIPCVIRNIPYGDSSSMNGNRFTFDEEKKDCDDNSAVPPPRILKEWPAVHRWSLDKLINDPDLAERGFKCGEDDDGYTIRMKLRYFIEYLQHNKDDSPLYIFDATFDEDKFAKRLLEDYTVPDYFSEDLFGLIGESKRPPYRWFLVGPCRSGTTVHIDPLGTSAWNTLLFGVKRWVLFPPQVPKNVVKGRKLILPGEDDEAIHYFTTILPRIKRRAAASGGKGDYCNFECYEFTQYPGETVFVPHGWWHAVMNVTHTVGVTQNYCSKRNFDEVWLQTRSGRKKMACSWLRKLQEHYPDLARRAKALNRRDRFVMWQDDPEAQRRYRKKKADKERKKREKRERKEKERARKKEKWGDHRTTERRKETDS
mmetsp:Transcript_404/g.730  ORF Transcript_404/g.730 Transcript_404/m.730 type:complete len:488 (+) Transcript_404:114-1577(+)|eukprot:scaffold20957_cov144-Skeletonema_menzelii.AAC.8